MIEFTSPQNNLPEDKQNIDDIDEREEPEEGEEYDDQEPN